MEITDFKVLKLVGKLDVLGSTCGHKFTVSKEPNGYAVWLDCNFDIALSSGHNAKTLERYVDGLRDMLLLTMQRGRE